MGLPKMKIKTEYPTIPSLFIVVSPDDIGTDDGIHSSWRAVEYVKFRTDKERLRPTSYIRLGDEETPEETVMFLRLEGRMEPIFLCREFFPIYADLRLERVLEMEKIG